MILVVDDQADARQALVKLVRRIGHEAIGVADGPQALLFLETALPKLILLDHRMPGMDGLDVLRHIRANPRTAHVPVVFFTAEESGLLRKDAMAAGAQGYIRKASMDWAEILASIDQYAKAAPSAAPIRTAPLSAADDAAER